MPLPDGFINYVKPIIHILEPGDSVEFRVGEPSHTTYWHMEFAKEGEGALIFKPPAENRGDAPVVVRKYNPKTGKNDIEIPYAVLKQKDFVVLKGSTLIIVTKHVDDNVSP